MLLKTVYLCAKTGELFLSFKFNQSHHFIILLIDLISPLNFHTFNNLFHLRPLPLLSFKNYSQTFDTFFQHFHSISGIFLQFTIFDKLMMPISLLKESAMLADCFCEGDIYDVLGFLVYFTLGLH